LAIVEKELQQDKKDNQALAQYINVKRKKEEVRKKEEEAQKKVKEEAWKKAEEEVCKTALEGQSSKDVWT
jgi:hypothetical protein